MGIWLWVGFIAFVLAALAIDLGVFHRRAREVSLRESFAWTLVWIFTALLFTIAVYVIYEGRAAGSGKEASLQYLTGYVIEKSLSFDNIFVIALIFTHFGIPDRFQHRVLFWGIMGALVLRGAMIGAGVALLRTFAWMTYVFGGLLLFTAVRLLFLSEEKFDPEKNRLLRLARRIFPVSGELAGERFFTRLGGKIAATPLFLALVVVESADVVFAVDSIPAIFAVTTDPFLVFTSNVFAILGLRSLYFVLARMIRIFQYLKLTVCIILVYVGVKMILAHHLPIPTGVSLAVVVGLLAAGIGASIAFPRPEPAEESS